MGPYLSWSRGVVTDGPPVITPVVLWVKGGGITSGGCRVNLVDSNVGFGERQIVDVWKSLEVSVSSGLFQTIAVIVQSLVDASFDLHINLKLVPQVGLE